MKQAYHCYICQWKGIEVIFRQDTNMLHCPNCQMPALAMHYEGGLIGSHPAQTDLPRSKDMPPPPANAGAIAKAHPRAVAVALEQLQILTREYIRLLGYCVRHKLEATERIIDAIKDAHHISAVIAHAPGARDTRDRVIKVVFQMFGPEANRILYDAGIESPQDIVNGMSDRLRKHYKITTPELPDGLTMENLTKGLSFAQSLGFKIPRYFSKKHEEQADKEEALHRLAAVLNLPVQTVIFKFTNLDAKLEADDIKFITDAAAKGDITSNNIEGKTIKEILDMAIASKLNL